MFFFFACLLCFFLLLFTKSSRGFSFQLSVPAQLKVSFSVLRHVVTKLMIICEQHNDVCSGKVSVAHLFVKVSETLLDENLQPPVDQSDSSQESYWESDWERTGAASGVQCSCSWL